MLVNDPRSHRNVPNSTWSLSNGLARRLGTGLNLRLGTPGVCLLLAAFHEAVEDVEFAV